MFESPFGMTGSAGSALLVRGAEGRALAGSLAGRRLLLLLLLLLLLIIIIIITVIIQ